MHNRFLDKRRRNPNVRLSEVKNVLPEHFASYYPKFIKLLEYYYTFEDENNSTELLHHLFAARDINETDITLLSYIEDELLLGESYFKGFGNNEVELRAAANFSSILFRSKGTKFAIEWFFRSFYNEDVEVVYTKENIFKIGDSASAIGPNSLRYLTDDKLYQTFALLIKTGVPISRWRDVFKLFSHPAGMYLGGEVAITDEVDIETIIKDYVAAYPSQSYALGGTFSADEGQTINLSVIGSGVNNGYLTGIDGVYWYGRHGTTSDADFGVNYYDGRSGLPDSNEPQYISISSSAGSIPIAIINDPATDPLEGEEWFAVRLEDKEGRYLDSANIVINDLIENYTLSFPNNGNLEEGNVYTVNLTGVNVPYYGETTVKYYFDPILSDQTLRDSDFYTWYQNPEPLSKWTAGVPSVLVGLPDSAGCGVPVQISGGVGSFTLDPRVDGIEDGTESVTLKIANVNNVDVGSGTFTIANNNPFIILSVPDIVEGNNLIIEIQTESYNIGKYLNYEITGDVTTESPQRLQTSSFTGSILVTNTTMQISIPTIVTPAYNNAGGGLTSGTVTVTDPNITASVVSQSTSFNIQDAPAEYELEGSETPGVEGNNITYNVTGSNIPDGTQVWFWITGSNPPNDANPNLDWTAVMPQSGSRQSITVNSNSGSSPTYTYASADGTEGRQYYEAYIYSAQTGGTKLAEQPRSIVEAAQFATIQIRAIDGGNNIVTSINETDENTKYRMEISAPFLADGVYRFYLKTSAPYRTSGSLAEFGQGSFIWDDINEPDEATTYATLNQINPTKNDPGGVRIISGSGALDFFATSDLIAEGNESFAFYLAESINNTLITLGSHSFTITDTSAPEYTITAPSGVNETENFTATIVVDSINNDATIDGNDVLYFELSGAAASQYTTTQALRSYNDGDVGQTDTVTFITTGDNAVVDPDRAGVLHVTRGDYNSGSPTQTVATKNFTLSDNAVIASNFYADPDTFDEGNSTTFRWNPGQYAVDGLTYYVRPTNVIPFTGTFTNNSTSISNVTPNPQAAFTAAGWYSGNTLVPFGSFEFSAQPEDGDNVFNWQVFAGPVGDPTSTLVDEGQSAPWPPQAGDTLEGGDSPWIVYDFNEAAELGTLGTYASGLVDDLKIFSIVGNQVGKASAASTTSITSTSTSSSSGTTNFWVGRESEVWDYFDVTANLQDVAGPISYVQANSEGTRVTNSAVNAAVTSDGVFTFGLYANHTDQNGSEIATEVVTISNLSAGAIVDLSGIAGTQYPPEPPDYRTQLTEGVHPYIFNSYETTNQNQRATATATMRFNPDGSYTTDFNEGGVFATPSPGVNWANGSTGDGSGYWIRARDTGNTIGSHFTGTTGVWLELNQARDFSVQATALAGSAQTPTEQVEKTVRLYIDIVQAPSAAEASVIFQNANANKDTKELIINAYALSIFF